jgi:hypothetical protein
LSPTEEDRRAKLRDDLARFWDLVERHLAAAQQVDPHQGRPSMAVVAVDLHHEAILTEASLPIPGRRPAVVPPEVLPRWHAVRKFRHFFRHGSVAVEFDPDELATVLSHLQQAVTVTAPAVRALLAALG